VATIDINFDAIHADILAESYWVAVALFEKSVVAHGQNSVEINSSA
jgi:hypothetical protein